MYNYYDEVLQVVEDAVNDGYSPEMLEPVDLEDYADALNEALWVDDSVTGNASGSFFCNAYMAEEALVGNWGLAAEALEELGCNEGLNPFARGAEWVDVSVRCYLLSRCIGDYIEAHGKELTERIEQSATDIYEEEEEAETEASCDLYGYCSGANCQYFCSCKGNCLC